MNVALSGGAVKGISYCGVFRKLEEQKVSIAALSGTSIGSVFCLMRILGYSADDMQYICLNIDIERLVTIDFDNPLEGLSSGNNISMIIKKILRFKGVPEDITMKGINEFTGKKLIVVATNVRTKEPVIFSDDSTTVVEAIRYSISIPFLFEKHGDYVDGCLSKNLPVDVFPVYNTIGFYFKRIVNDSNYLFNVFSCLQTRGNKYEIEYYRALGYRLIQIDVDIPGLTFDISLDVKKQLVDSGYKSID